MAVDLHSKRFGKSIPRKSDWTHLVVNYLGPNDGEGIYVYQDGVQTGNNTIPRTTATIPSGYGGVILGKLVRTLDWQYRTVAMDDLLFFNESLREGQITQLKDMVSK